MSANHLQKNILSRMQQFAEATMQQKRIAAEILLAVYGQENIGDLTDEEIQESAEFKHVTAVEVQAARNAINEYNAAVGEYVAGTIMQRLTKIISTIPK